MLPFLLSEIQAELPMGIISRVQTEKELMPLKSFDEERQCRANYGRTSFMTGHRLPPSLGDSEINRRLMWSAVANRALALI